MKSLETGNPLHFEGMLLKEKRYMEPYVEIESAQILRGAFLHSRGRKLVSFNNDSSSQLKVGLGLTLCVYCTPN